MTYPTVRPSLTLDFANSRQLDPRITFTRSSIATYLNPDTDRITTATSGIARIEKEGLLIEESRTNIIEYSNPDVVSYWGTPTWATESGAVTDNAAEAPDGTTTARKYKLGFLTSWGQIRKSLGVTGNHVISVFVKKVNSGDSLTVINKSTGDTEISSGTEEYPNGWTRYWFFVNNIIQLRIQFDADVFIWGVQVEAGTFVTSYIPTSGTSLVRAADVASITETNFSSWYNQGASSLFAKYIVSGGYGVFQIWDGNNNDLNYWQLGAVTSAGGVIGFATRSNQGSSSSTYQRGRIDETSNYGYVIKQAASIATDELAFNCFTRSSSGDFNNNTGSPDQSIGAYVPPSVDRFTLTHDLDGVIHISCLLYYNYRPSNTKLKSLTL